MTTSTTLSTAYGIICDAMKDVGKLRAGSEPDPETLAENMRRLNKLINFLMTQGLKLWLILDQALTLLPPLINGNGVALYTLGPSGTVVMQKPLKIVGAYYLYNNGNQYPLIPLSYDEYKRLSNLLQPGAVNSYMVDKQQLTLNVYLWNPPDAFTAANGSVHLLIEQSVTNFVSITDTMNFPIEWGLMLEWGLADQISAGQPIAVQARAAAMARMYREAMEDWDVEDASTSFQPNSRNAQHRGRFR